MDGLDIGHDVIAEGGHDVQGLARLDAQERRNPLVGAMVVDQIRQREVGQSIAVVREEDVLALQVFLHRLQPLADRGVDARIHKRDRPIMDVRM